MLGFMEELREQRWDDHRYYHHNRINQSLHLISSITFVVVYVLLFTEPVLGTLLGWLFAMLIRQAGHFFFEPKDYDTHNQASHEEKEALKVGYNLHRKVILLSVFALVPVVFYASPSVFGLLAPFRGVNEYVARISYVWLILGVGAVVFRGVHLFFLRGFQTGIVWMTKIVTDPFHDIMLYWRAPIQVLRGEMYDPQGPRRVHA
jgi:hypothetical protein